MKKRLVKAVAALAAVWGGGILAADSVTFTLPWADETATANSPVVVSDGSGSFSIHTKDSTTTTLADGTTVLAGTVTGGDAITQVATLHATGESDVASYANGLFLDINGATVTGEAIASFNTWWSNSTSPKHESDSTSLSSGDVMVQIRSGTVAFAFGGYGGLKSPTLPGNSGVTIMGTAVLTGSAFGGWQSQHNDTPVVTGDSAVKVLNVQSQNTAAAIGQTIPNDVIAGGSVYYGNNKSGATHKGNTAVIVKLADDATGTFAKRLVGGSFSKKDTGNNDTSNLSHEKGTSVSVSAPDTVTFSASITGGSLLDDTGSKADKISSTVKGNATVTLDGGVYTGTITAGGVGAKSSVNGTATLKLKSGDFTGATLAGGNATKGATLEVYAAAKDKLPSADKITGFDNIYYVIESTSDTVPSDLSDMYTGVRLENEAEITELNIPEGLTLTLSTSRTVGDNLTITGEGTLRIANATLATVYDNQKLAGLNDFKGTIEVAAGGVFQLPKSDSGDVTIQKEISFRLAGGTIKDQRNTKDKSKYLMGAVEVVEGTSSKINVATGNNFSLEGALTGTGELTLSFGYGSSRYFKIKRKEGATEFGGTLKLTSNGWYSFEENGDTVTLGALEMGSSCWINMKKDQSVIVGSKGDSTIGAPIGSENVPFTLKKVGANTTLTIADNTKQMMPTGSTLEVAEGTVVVNSSNLGAAVTVKSGAVLKGAGTVGSVTFEDGAKIAFDGYAESPEVGATVEGIVVAGDITGTPELANSPTLTNGRWKLKTKSVDGGTQFVAEFVKGGIIIIIR